MYEFDYDIRGNVSMVKNAIIQINFEYDHLESGDLYADVGTGGPCVGPGAALLVLAAAIVVYVMWHLRDVITRKIEEQFKQKNQAEQSGGGNGISSCGGAT